MRDKNKVKRGGKEVAKRGQREGKEGEKRGQRWGKEGAKRGQRGGKEGAKRGQCYFKSQSEIVPFLVHFRIQFSKIPENSIRDSSDLVHFEKLQWKGQNLEKKGKKEGFEGARPKREVERLPLKEGIVLQLWKQTREGN